MTLGEAMSQEQQGFRGVPGVPDGWELVGIRQARLEDWYLPTSGNPTLWADIRASCGVYPIIRKIEPKYRQFASAEEFTPHRDRWWTWKDDRSNTFPPAAFGKLGHHYQSWKDSFDRKVFDDGTPFGVRVEE